MKNFLFISFLLCALFTACTKSENSSFKVTPDKLLFDAVASTKYIEVQSNKNWTYSKIEADSWYSVTQLENKLEVVAQVNTSLDKRKSSITITSGSDIKTVELEQSAEDKSFSINIDSIKTNYDGGTYKVEISTNENFEIVTPEEWITFVQSGKNLSVYIETNPSHMERFGIIKFQDKYTMQQLGVLTINQEGIDLALINAVFTDMSCSKLKPGVTQVQIGKLTGLYKDIATQLSENKYDTKRVKSYKAVYTPAQTVSQLKLKTPVFSAYENVTGIYLEKGKAEIFVGDLKGKTVGVRLPNWMRKIAPGHTASSDPDGWGIKATVITLKEGLNIIDVPYSTNAYIDYIADNPDAEPEIIVNFPTGKINGYFNANTDSNEDWKKLLDNASSPIMDIVGKYMQLAYPVEFLKKYSYPDGLGLMKAYDDILEQQYIAIGCFKYNKVPKNKILARVNYHYYMFKDNSGVAFLGDESTMKKVINVYNTVSKEWGIHHELGHTLQIYQMTWVEMNEVSNNILAQFSRIGLGVTSRLTSYYATARKNIIENQISYLTEKELLNRLVPFWQLHLYHSIYNGKADFFADVHQEMRNRNAAGAGTSYKNLFDFVKIACDVTKTDLTDFFDKWGFFIVGNVVGYDVTLKEVDDVKQYIKSKSYPIPGVDITTLED